MTFLSYCVCVCGGVLINAFFDQQVSVRLIIEQMLFFSVMEVITPKAFLHSS